MKSIYFASYAFMATVGVLIIGWAQYNRKKSEGIPLNFTVIKALAGLAIAMWVAAGLSAYAYKNGDSTETVFLAASVIGALLVAFFTWQMIQVSAELDRNRKELKDLATRDALTHSWNRRIFHENLQTEIDRAKVSKQPLSLLMFDIDDFHEVNERFGYKIGDGILRELVGRIFAAIRQQDSVYRYGGEELALILPGKDEPSAEAFARQLTTIISDKPYDVGDQGPIAITVSIGVTALEDAIDTDEDMVEHAISALHHARAEKGNFIAVFKVHTSPAS